MGATGGIDPPMTTLLWFGMLRLPFRSTTGQDRHAPGRAGGHTSDGAWSRKLVSGHTNPSGGVHHALSCGQADSLT
jgi:hypothetical protein